MRKSYKLIIINSVFTETSNRYAHSVFVVDILAYLRTVVFFQILDELFRCTRKFQFLRKTFEVSQSFDQLFFCRFFTEFNKYCCCMSVQYRNTQALAYDDWFCCRYDHSVFNLTPQSQRLFLALFFFSTDIWNDIVFHFRPVFKCLSCSGNCLICSSNYFIWFKFFPGSKYRCIALNGAVWFNSDESLSSTKAFLLILDHIKMFRVDFRHYHRHIRCPAMCTVVGNNRSLCLCVFFFDRFDLIFGHVNCGKHKVNSRSNFFYFINIHNYDILYCFRHWSIHFPSAANSFLICLSSASRACCQSNDLKPRMVFQKRNKSLSYHTCST